MDKDALVIATRNPHKVVEIRTILGDRLDYYTLGDFQNAPEVIEDAGSFDGNATKKAVEIADWLGALPATSRQFAIGQDTMVLADDSGLEVDALGGAPGVYSARFAGLESGRTGNSADADNIAKLLRLLEAVPVDQRTARFRCVLALMPVFSLRLSSQNGGMKPAVETFEGICEGYIAFEPRGSSGFGYDPLFRPVGYDATFAELGEDMKHRLSHRALALAKLREAKLRRDVKRK